MSNKKSVTMKDVSKLAGVSIATVSRAINCPQLVNSSTKQLVESAMAQLKFKPSSSSLGNRVPQKDLPVVVFIPDMFNESLVSVAQGACEFFLKKDIPTLIWNSSESQDWELRGYHSMRLNQMRGAIFIISVVGDIPFPTQPNEVPVVMVERSSTQPKVDTISVEHEHGMFLLMKHLAKMGHQHIALLSGDISSDNSLRKISSYKKALTALNLPWNTNYIVPTEWGIAGGITGVRKVVVGSPEVTAVVGVTDVLALGALHGLENMGLCCPGDLSVAGFDNMPKSAFLHPRVTTLSYPAYDMGHMAAQYLFDRFETPGLDGRHKIFPVELIKGSTTGPAHPLTKRKEGCYEIYSD